jgi:preprotein translocase subunit SecF
MELIRPNTNFDFMRLRRISVTISLAILLVAVAGFFVRGLNLAIDFTGGAVVELHFAKPMDPDTLRKTLAAKGFADATVLPLGEETKHMVRLRANEAEEASPETLAARVLTAVQSPDNVASIANSESLGSQVGKEIVDNGIIAILFVALGFLIYISIRFEWKFAVAAILTTLHDVIVVTGIFSLFHLNFDIVVFAGVLSIMGYSINDTIVVFDRVRENFRTLGKATPIEVLNRSVNETLSRTIITSFVALLTVLALYFFGGESLKGMALSQILGIVIGTLSSIFFACPLLLWLGVTKFDLMKGQDEDPRLAAMP